MSDKTTPGDALGLLLAAALLAFMVRMGWAFGDLLVHLLSATWGLLV